jgi:hypothetical protein
MRGERRIGGAAGALEGLGTDAALARCILRAYNRRGPREEE